MKSCAPLRLFIIAYATMRGCTPSLSYMKCVFVQTFDIYTVYSPFSNSVHFSLSIYFTHVTVSSSNLSTPGSSTPSSHCKQSLPIPCLYPTRTLFWTDALTLTLHMSMPLPNTLINSITLRFHHAHFTFFLYFLFCPTWSLRSYSSDNSII